MKLVFLSIVLFVQTGFSQQTKYIQNFHSGTSDVALHRTKSYVPTPVLYGYNTVHYPTVHSPEDLDYTQIESKVKENITQHHAVGAAVAIVKQGKVIYVKGFGYRDFEKKLPVDEHTIFGIGSCTKAFTAAILGILEERNMMKMNDKPSTHIPELKFYNKMMNDEVTIHHLLSHSTGMGARNTESSIVLFQPSDKEKLVDRLQHLKPETTVGERFIYNNYMYAIAGLIGEQISGKKYAENLQELFFMPLDMHHTYYDFFKAQKQSDFSLGYAVDGMTPYKVLPEDMSSRGPSGGIFSSVYDMAQWLQLWMNNGIYNDIQVLPKNYLRQAINAQIQFPNANDSINRPRYYGYGWMRENDNGYTRISHSGGVSGYTSNVVFFPKEQLGIVVLSNQTSTTLASIITDLYVDKILNIKRVNNNTSPNYSIIHPTTDVTSPTILNNEKPPTSILSELTGTYYHPAYGSVNITLENKTLYASFPFTTFRLEHREGNVFLDYNTVETPLVYWNFMELDFQENADKTIYGFTLNYENPGVLFKKI